MSASKFIHLRMILEDESQTLRKRLMLILVRKSHLSYFINFISFLSFFLMKNVTSFLTLPNNENWNKLFYYRWYVQKFTSINKNNSPLGHHSYCVKKRLSLIYFSFESSLWREESCAIYFPCQHGFWCCWCLQNIWSYNHSRWNS